jgi:hypothetical protein
MTRVSQRTATPIRFAASLETIDTSTIVRLPEQASRQLPSRGQVVVQGSINGHDFRTVLEPDGLKGHWLRIDQERRRAARRDVGDLLRVELEPAPDWPEPDVTPDLAEALAGAPQRIHEIWQDITPMARSEWARG